MREIKFRNTIIPANSFVVQDNENIEVTSIRVARNDDKRKFEFVLNNHKSVVSTFAIRNITIRIFATNDNDVLEFMEKKKVVAQLEQDSLKKNTAQIFIETPYRNNQLIKDLLQHCHPQTKLCIAVDITAPTQWIKTKTVAEWKKETVDIHKRLAIFLLQA